MSETTAKIIKKHAMLAGHRTGSDPMFLHRRSLQKLSIRCSTRSWSRYACRLVTRTIPGPVRGLPSPRFTALWWHGSH
jgi:hypothetical protein